MKKVRDAIAAILDTTTLADVRAQIARATQRCGYRDVQHLTGPPPKPAETGMDRFCTPISL